MINEKLNENLIKDWTSGTSRKSICDKYKLSPYFYNMFENKMQTRGILREKGKYKRDEFCNDIDLILESDVITEYLNEKNIALKSEKSASEYENIILSLQKENDELRKCNDENVKDKKRYKNDLLELETLSEKMLRRNAKLENDNDILKKDCFNLEKQYNELSEQYNELRKVYKQLKKDSHVDKNIIETQTEPEIKFSEIKSQDETQILENKTKEQLKIILKCNKQSVNGTKQQLVERIIENNLHH